MSATSEVSERLDRLDVRSLDPPPRLIINPRAGQKLGLSTNAATTLAVGEALAAAGLNVDVRETRSRRHATELARAAVSDGCKLIIAAGGDGTVAEAGEALVDTDAALGIMPLGSIMNMARTLCIPRDLAEAARVIAAGQVLHMDVGRVSGHLFLEAAGAGLAAGLFGYFNRLDSGKAHASRVVRAALRFLRSLGTPRVTIIADGQRFDVRAPMVTVSNAPFVGAAYAVAPEARIDDGLLDVMIFRGIGVPRLLLHLVLVAGGRRLPPPPGVELVRAQHVELRTPTGHRRLPIHADGDAVGITPATIDVLPAALQVVVGAPTAGTARAWSVAIGDDH